MPVRRLPGFFAALVEGVAVTPGTTTGGVDLVLDPGGVVDGVIRGPQGEAVAGATVSVGSQTAGCNPCSQPDVTGTDGAFSLAAPSGPVFLTVTAPAGTSYVPPGTIAATVSTGGTSTVAVTLHRGLHGDRHHRCRERVARRA